MRGSLLFFLTVWLVACALKSNGQSNKTADTVKVSRPADTARKSPPLTAPLDNIASSASAKLKALDPTKQVNGIGSSASSVKDKGKAAVSGIADKLKTAKKPSVTYDVIIGNDVLFHPLPVPGVVNNQRVLNAFSIMGSVKGWIIPLNIAYTSNRNVNAPTPLSNSLFKFDFDSKQFANGFKSDFQQYQNLQQTVFGGSSFTNYVRATAMQKLSAEEQGVTGKVANPQLAQYLSNPQNVKSLLTLNHDQIKQKLIAEGTAKASTEITVKPPAAAGSEIQSANIKTTAIQELSKNEALNKYVGDPANQQALSLMTPEQIEQKLTTVASQKATAETSAVPTLGANKTASATATAPAKAETTPPVINAEVTEKDYRILILEPRIRLEPIIKPIIEKIIAARQESMHKLSMDVFLASHQGNVPKMSQLLDNQQQMVNAQKQAALAGLQSRLLKQPGQTPSASGAANQEKAELEKNAESVASSITGIKNELQFKGYDINKLMQAQELQEGGASKPGTSETAGSLLNKRPENAVQQVFSRVDALKIGSFGGKIPGNTDGQDMFLNGTAVTYKAQATPITIGFGSTNDMSSLKDADYRSSVYDPPKKLTFIGAQINRGIFGKVNVSFISAINREVANSNYSISTVSSDNVAFTLSKELNVDKVGHFIFDASKSATLSNNNYIAGVQPVIDRQGGLNNDLASTLFESLSFGVNHMLDIRELDMSDNVYFSYSGMGYQNPANTGYGGARMKFGGNVKKSFYKHKLTFTLRSDFNNMPISYSSNDKWKTYQVAIDTKYIIDKKFNVAFKYSTNSTSKMIDNVSSNVYSFQKIQFDGNATYKIGKYFSVSHLTLGKQDFSNNYVSMDPGNMLMINYTQSVVLTKNSITANVFYNKELSPLQIIGNMLTSDISYSYTLFNKLSMSTGVTYLDNQGIVQQTGIRQSLQVFAGKNFSLDTYVDLSKNMITPKYPDLYSQCRAELSLKYHLNN